MHKSQTSSSTLGSVAIAVTVLVLVNVKSANTIDIKLKCSNNDEYYYAKPGSHCTSYYRCYHGTKEEHECGPGSMFDFYKQTCIRNSGICYEPVCTGRTNGVYQDTTHACRRSFTCHVGRVISIDNCPAHHLHNGRQCMPQDLVVCELPETTAIGYPFAGDNRCVGKSDGSYGINDCANYLICRNSEVLNVLTCPVGHRFSNDHRKCVSASQVPYCSNLGISNEIACVNKENGANIDPSSNNCKSYLVCKDGKFISREKCGNQAVFNGQHCVPEPLFTCANSANHLENDLCRHKSNGFHTNPRLGCASYVRCMSQRIVETFTCPSGQYFDPDERNCVFEKFPERRKCISQSKSFDCQNFPQGFYQDKSSQSGCRSYYFCFNGYKTEYHCAIGKVFDGESCVSKVSYKCPAQDVNSCHQKTDGYYKDTEGSCRAYFYCSNGHKFTYLCEEGYIFDGDRCSRNSHKQQCRSDTFCSDKSDGYYADVKSNCRNYAFCMNHEKIMQLTCRGSKVFDGQKCVQPGTLTCRHNSHHREFNRVTRKCTTECVRDGFFTDIESNCRNYYFCISGKKSTLSCPDGQLFNGELCVSQDRFNCPNSCRE